MKRLLYLASIAFLCSCSGAGTADPVTPPATGEEGGDALKEGYYIYVDKATIEADGKDIATFTVKDHEGNVVSTEDNIGTRKIWYVNVADDTRLDAYSTGLTSIVDGEYEFAALYNNVKTLNTVKVKVQNRARYEVFHKNVAIFKITGTWCPNCPSMTTTLDALGEDADEHSIVLACHWNDGAYSVVYGETSLDLGASAALHVNPELDVLGAPSNVYDLAVHSDVRTVSGVTKEIMQRRIDCPAATGISISSVVMDGSDLKVTASVKASKAGDYDLTCAVLADNVNAGGQGSKDGLYHHMVIAIDQTNFMNMKNETRFSLKADEEYTREFVFPFGDNVPGADMLENLSAVVLSLKKDASGKTIVDNSAHCAYGSAAGYVYNE